MSKIPSIKQVIYSNPVTVIIWGDGTKTISRCDDDDIYDELTGFMLCVFKKALAPKAMRKMFSQYVYDVDSDKIKWQSTPTWLLDGWECSIGIDDEFIDGFKEAFNVGEPYNAKVETVGKTKATLDDDRVVADLVNYMLDNIDGGIYVF